jgi:RNA polymerase sigma-70 factor (family 1)
MNGIPASAEICKQSLFHCNNNNIIIFLFLQSYIPTIQLDEQIITGLREGDSSSFRDLYDSYKDKVYNIAVSYTKNPQDAEELTQDVFVEIFRSIDTFKGDSNFSTWIYRITVNKSLDFIRYSKRKKRFGFISNLFHPETGEQVVERPDFIHPGIEAENKELSQYLFKALEKLPETQKTAFILSKIEGLSNPEISGILKISVSSVESLQFRAKQNLRKYLSGMYDKLV